MTYFEDADEFDDDVAYSAPAPSGPPRPTSPPPRVKDPLTRQTVLRRAGYTLGILAVLGGFWLAMSRTQTGDGQPVVSGTDSRYVRILSPRASDNVVNQQAQISVVVDIAYVASMEVNGIGIPDAELTKLPQASGTQLLFAPGEGKRLTSLPEGENCVRIYLARADGTAETVPPAQWCFRVV